MISSILEWLYAELRSLDEKKEFIALGNIPAYQVKSEKRMPPNRVILSLGSFNGMHSQGKKTTGFKMNDNADEANSKLELKIILLADYDDQHYLEGIDWLEKIYVHLQKDEIWSVNPANEALKLEIKNDAGTRGDISFMVRGASGKFLPALSYTIRMAD